MYLEDDDLEIRKAASVACCRVLVREPCTPLHGNYTSQLIGEVLEKLLTVGIADPEPSIRLTVLSSLDSGFDPFLAQADNIRSLFIALNDEVFSIREASIEIIGRLTVHNPAYVMPSLRKTLIQFLTELEYSSVTRNKDEAARLMCRLISTSNRLIKPYVEPILKVLQPKLKDSSPTVVARILDVIGALAQAGGHDLDPHIDDLMPIIIETLQDQSSNSKREAALRTLGQLASNTGDVIMPYLKFPSLLTTLINILKTELVINIRKETVKVMGILGALDPYQHKVSFMIFPTSQ